MLTRAMYVCARAGTCVHMRARVAACVRAFIGAYVRIEIGV
jgi:hypothetical protein